MFAKNHHLHWIAGKTNILCKCLIYIYFQFWVWLFRLLFCFIYMNSKIVSQILKILFQTENINISVIRGVVPFLVDMLN